MMKHALTWITASRRSGAGKALGLIAGYLLDTPPGDVPLDTLLGTTAELVTLFRRGRMVPRDGARPQVVKTDFLPEAEVLRPYREVTGKVVYLVRDPRDIVSAVVRTTKSRPEDREQLAVKAIGRLLTESPPGKYQGNWIEHAAGWTSLDRLRVNFPNMTDICVVRFEDLRDDPAAELHRMIDALGLPDEVDADRIKRAVDGWMPENMRETPIAEELPGISAFREPRRAVVESPERELALSEIGPAAVEAYERRLQEDAEFAALVKRFGYGS